MYESALDIKHELSVKSLLEERWGMVLQKLPVTYNLDYMGTRDGVLLSWIEIKARNITIDQYPSIMLSLTKFLKGIELYTLTKAPFIFVVKTVDGLYYHTYDPQLTYPIEYGGRTTQTRTPVDREPVVQIPSSWFIEIDRENGHVA